LSLKLGQGTFADYAGLRFEVAVRCTMTYSGCARLIPLTGQPT
jgi:hypothetical protein